MPKLSPEVLRALLAATPDALLAVDRGGVIVFVNDQAGSLFGWTVDELVGASIDLLVPEAISARHRVHRARYVEGPVVRPLCAGLQLRARRKDGSTFPAEISLSARADDVAGLLVLAAVRDVSDRIEMERERQREQVANRREQSHRLESLGQLAGGVAHDFNNLLGVILSYVALASRRVEDPDVTADLDEIRAAAERAASLTRQLLTFASRDVAHPQAVEVNGMVEAVTAMLARTLGEHIEQRLDLWLVPLKAMADPHQLDQILVNLMLNARDAMPSGGLLTVATHPAPVASRIDGDGFVDDVVITVNDKGTGMSSEVLSRAFEPFFTTKPEGAGTGLGLATVYGIVQQSGGTVTIESNEGEGTTITVRLLGAPPVEDASPTVVGAPLPAAGSVGGGERILFVEDDEALRTGTARLLAASGYEVLTAVDGLEALALIEADAGAIRAVVTDVAMPRMRGDEMAARLARIRPDLPVICMSGYAPSEAHDVERLLIKPVAEEPLLSAIREVLDG